MSQANATTDHNVIRQWVESRKGRPSVVKSTKRGSAGQGGLLRIDFNKPEDSLDEVSWDEFFETFDQNNLAFLYQDETASGRKSRFNKFVSRDTVEREASAEEDEAADEDEDLEDEDEEELQDEDDADEDWEDEEEEDEEEDEDDDDEDEDDRR